MTFLFHCQREVESLYVTHILKRPSADRSLVIVFGPLIALMKDQVRSLLEKNVRSAYVSDDDECSDVYKQACNGELSIIFISPESLHIPASL